MENLRLIKWRPYITYRVSKIFKKLVFFGAVEKVIVHIEAQKIKKTGCTLPYGTVQYGTVPCGVCGI